MQKDNHDQKSVMVQSSEGQKVKTAIQEDYTRVDIYYQTLDVKLMRQIPVVSVRRFSF